MVKWRYLGLAISPLALLAVASCGPKGQQPPGDAALPQVAYVTIKDQPVTLSAELPGRTSPYEASDVRPQVNGLILARLFREGDSVRAGQALYRIDPQPYEAQVANARASLAKARASIASSEALQRRYGELVKINAISRQDYENAITSAQQAVADVAAQQASLKTAQIDLARTVVKAPITGTIGRSTYTPGALVTASQTNALATIQRLDPIYFDIQLSSADMLRYRREMMSGAMTRGKGASEIRLKLEDGSIYPEPGTIKFADVTVDTATGSQVIRAVFPNPHGLLLPGMFARAELIEGTQAHAMLVPQRAISRDERGNPVAMVVAADGKLEPRPLTAPRTVGDSWLVTDGLRPGDKVVVEGAQNLRPGMPVKAVPYQAAAGRQASSQGK